MRDFNRQKLIRKELLREYYLLLLLWRFFSWKPEKQQEILFRSIQNFMKWYMKCFIYWTADLKSGEQGSSQLWMQFKQLRIEARKSQDFNGVWTVSSRYWCDALTNWAMKPLTLRAGDLWVLMSPWGMNVKWYMKFFIYWTADTPASRGHGFKLLWSPDFFRLLHAIA